ncbi:hypothetical protein A0H81_14759 [Grifola frondosa]|uniref:Uncharacterized protein n=1 Tax=Grifola frondosa TaxID=5627 RepID=A0A1C7LKI2_GRIFR|nr:hypothetical protein A0H81_14759 [Grifola frondosa]
MSTVTHTPSSQLNMNSSTLIARIPDDVLRGIFYLLIVASPALLKQALQDRTGWLSVSYVCSYWRHLALASPELWTFIHVYETSPVAMLEEFIIRSKDALLSFKFMSPVSRLECPETFPQIVQTLSLHIGRISEIEIQETCPGKMRTILTLFTLPAPQLRTLRLHGSDLLPESSMFGGQMPLLRQINVRGPTQWFPYQNLTELVVSIVNAPPAEEIIWTLQRCPDLMILSLFFARSILPDNIDDEELVPKCHIELCHLERLRLRTRNYDDMAFILSHLSFSSTTSVQLTFAKQRPSSLPMAKNCPSLRDILSRVDWAYLEFHILLDCDHLVLRCEDPDVEIAWGWDADEEEGDGFDEDEWESPDPSSLPFPDLQHVTFLNDADLSVMQLKTAFDIMPSVFSMECRVAEVYELQLFVALGTVFRSSQTGASRVLCPNLKLFKITRLAQLEYEDDEMNTLQDIIECFKNRAEAGASLQSLKIRLQEERDALEFPPEVLMQLKEIIEENGILFVVIEQSDD